VPCVDNIQAQKVISGFTLSGVCRVVFIQLKDNPTAFANNVTRPRSNFGFARRVFVVKGARRRQPDKVGAFFHPCGCLLVLQGAFAFSRRLIFRRNNAGVAMMILANYFSKKHTHTSAP
jgi:hypothetical protein